MQVFQYYKQLINFHNRGDPHFMLKCINPKEVCLLNIKHSGCDPTDGCLTADPENPENGRYDQQ